MRDLGWLLAIAIACAGCGPSTGPTGPRGGGGGDTAGSGDSVAGGGTANAAACPARFTAATGTCSATAPCDFPEGSCVCGPPIECHGGAAMPPMPDPPPPPPPNVWRCTATPPAVRADGCPGTLPADNVCSKDGQKCDYQGVCFSGSTAICQGGQWVSTPWPPPP